MKTDTNVATHDRLNRTSVCVYLMEVIPSSVSHHQSPGQTLPPEEGLVTPAAGVQRCGRFVTRSDKARTPIGPSTAVSHPPAADSPVSLWTISHALRCASEGHGADMAFRLWLLRGLPALSASAAATAGACGSFMPAAAALHTARCEQVVVLGSLFLIATISVCSASKASCPFSAFVSVDCCVKSDLSMPARQPPIDQVCSCTLCGAASGGPVCRCQSSLRCVSTISNARRLPVGESQMMRVVCEVQSSHVASGNG